MGIDQSLGMEIDELYKMQNNKIQVSEISNKSLRIENLAKQKKPKKKENKDTKNGQGQGSQFDYLSDSENGDYTGVANIEELDDAAQVEHIKKLWRTCYNCSFGVAMMLLQMQAFTSKIHLFGRQLVAQ